MPEDKSLLLEELLSDLVLPKNLVDSSEEISKEELKNHYKQFDLIYKDGYRHSYSQLSKFLESNSPDTYSSLCIWLVALAEYGSQHDKDKESHDETPSTSKSLKKLLDHIELESIRLDRMKAVLRYSQDIQEIKKELESTVKSATAYAESAKNNVEKYHEQSIAILSIFSAVVLAFMGGVSFSSGILGNISSTSLFRLLITILLLGFVLFNSIFILLKFVFYIVYKEVPKTFKRSVLVFNLVLLGLTSLILMVYCIGFGVYLEAWAANICS